MTFDNAVLNISFLFPETLILSAIEQLTESKRQAGDN